MKIFSLHSPGLNYSRWVKLSSQVSRHGCVYILIKEENSLLKLSITIEYVRDVHSSSCNGKPLSPPPSEPASYVVKAKVVPSYIYIKQFTFRNPPSSSLAPYSPSLFSTKLYIRQQVTISHSIQSYDGVVDCPPYHSFITPEIIRGIRPGFDSGSEHFEK